MLRPATPFTRAFGGIILKYRKRRGLSQEALGFESGIHPTLVSQVERGKTVPSLRTVELLARALDVPPSRLVKAAEDQLARGRRSGTRSGQ